MSCAQISIGRSPFHLFTGWLMLTNKQIELLNSPSQSINLVPGCERSATYTQLYTCEFADSHPTGGFPMIVQECAHARIINHNVLKYLGVRFGFN